MAEGGASRRRVEPDNFKAGVTNKMRVLLGDQYENHEKKINEIVEKMTKMIVKRDTITGDGTQVDKSRASADHYQSAGTLPAELDKQVSPKKAAQDDEEFPESLIKSYQYELFIKLKKSGRIHLYNVGEKDGWLYSDGQEINEETFCQVIDQLSNRFFQDFRGHPGPTSMPDDQDRNIAEELAYVQEICRNILMGRFQVIMIVKNDQQVDTMLSFASLLVCLTLYRGKVTGVFDVNPTGSFKV